MRQRPEIIYGAGGHARELMAHLHSESIPVACFVDDFAPSRTVMGLPVLTRAEAIDRFDGSSWHVAFGNIDARRDLLKKLENHGLSLASYVSCNTSTTPWTQIDAPAQIFRGCILSCDVKISHSVVINHGCILSHDVSVGPYSFIAPGVRIAGHVQIGEGVWIGAGTTIRNGSSDTPLTIGDGAIIGLGSCVVRDIPAHTTCFGNPARVRII